MMHCNSVKRQNCYTSKFLEHLFQRLLDECCDLGINAVAEPPFGNYDEVVR